MSYPGLDTSATSGVIPPYQKDFFVTAALGNFGGGQGNDANTMVVPLLVQNGVNFDAIRILAGPTAYTGWKFGLYEIDETSSPAALGSAVVEATGLNGTNDAYTTHTFTSTAVPKGAYWLALSPQGGSGNVRVVSPATLGATSGTITGQLTGSYDISTGVANSGSSMTLTTAGTIAAATQFSGDSGVAPICGLRVA